MRMPPNYGEKYTEDFVKVFADLATRYKCAYVPFLLQEIAANRAYTQDDNLHPTALAQPLILDTVWKSLAPMLTKR
jgi:acyl-CoA thioesterase-1